MKRVSIRTVFFYLFGFAAAFVFFAVLLFPGSKVAVSLSSLVNHTFDRVRIHAENAQLKPFLRIALPQADFEVPGILQAKLHDVSIHPALISIFKADKTLGFTGRFAKGDFKGRIENWNFKDHQFKEAVISFSGLKIDSALFKMTRFDLMVSSSISGRITGSGASGKAKGQLALSEFSTRTAQNKNNAAADPASLAFDRVEIDFEVDSNRVHIKRLSARGPLLNVDLEGALVLGEKSSVNLSGRFTPSALYLSKIRAANPGIKPDLLKKKDMTIRITGEMTEPQIRLD